MFMNKAFLVTLMFLLYSFLGWIMETIYCMIIDKKFVNRGFLIGPVCPIYGFGGILIVFFLDKYRDDVIVLFCMAIIICAILEYFTSYILEKIFKTRWWDYSEKKFNLNGRISLDTMVAFGVLAILMVYVINPFVMNLIDKANPNVLKLITIFFFILFVIDTIVSSKIIYNIKGVGIKFKDGTEEISNKVREVLRTSGVLTRRVANAFPNFIVKGKVVKKKD